MDGYGEGDGPRQATRGEAGTAFGEYVGGDRDEVRDVAPVELALRELTESIERLHNAVGRVEQRAKPVMMQAPSADERAVPMMASVGSSPVATSIMDRANAVASVTAHLNWIAERIEL